MNTVLRMTSLLAPGGGTVVLIGGVAVVGFLAYKVMTTTPEDIGKGVGGVVVGAT